MNAKVLRTFQNPETLFNIIQKSPNLLMPSSKTFVTTILLFLSLQGFAQEKQINITQIILAITKDVVAIDFELQ